MTNYKRNFVPGGTFFFTVNLLNRKQALLVDYIDELRISFKEVLVEHPFSIDAIVVLPDHIHAIFTLPLSDADYSNRWRKIKSNFSRQVPFTKNISKSRKSKGERGIWQRRFWEHTIRDDVDLQNHINYIHFNPIKHGYCEKSIDWPYSTFQCFADKGVYPKDWGMGFVENIMHVGEFKEN